MSYTSISQAYQTLTTHHVPGPQSASYIFGTLLLPLALLIPPSILAHSQLKQIFLPAIYACFIHAWYRIGGLDVLSMSAVLWSTVLIGWYDVRGTFRYVRWRERDAAPKQAGGKTKEANVEEEAYPAALSRRIPWVLTLLVSMRLTGWRTGDAKRDAEQPYKPMTRKAYLQHAYSILLVDYLLLDLTWHYIPFDPYFHNASISVDTPFPHMNAPTSSLLDPETARILSWLWILPPRLLRSAVLAAQAFGVVSAMFYLPAPALVALNYIGFLDAEWSPHTWPVLYGPFSAVWERGIRGVWGEWWHQNSREISTVVGKALTAATGMVHKSALSYVVVVTSTCFLSGVMHAGLVPPEPLSHNMSANSMRLHVAGFFWAQAVGISCEVAFTKIVSHIVPSVKTTLLAKTFVLFWTAAWFCLTLPILTPLCRELGYWNLPMVPSSIFRPIMWLL